MGANRCECSVCGCGFRTRSVLGEGIGSIGVLEAHGHQEFRLSVRSVVGVAYLLEVELIPVVSATSCEIAFVLVFDAVAEVLKYKYLKKGCYGQGKKDTKLNSKRTFLYSFGLTYPRYECFRLLL